MGEGDFILLTEIPIIIYSFIVAESSEERQSGLNMEDLIYGLLHTRILKLQPALSDDRFRASILL